MRERRHAQTCPDGRRGARRRRVRRRASALSLGIVWLSALVAGGPIPADAGVVYGRVYKDGQPQTRRALQVAGKDARFTSDEQGRYSILLAPGVHCVQSDGLEARIQSHPQVTWFDFPVTDNTLLADGNRFALVLSSVLSREVPLKNARLKIVWFPKHYFTPRERPLDDRRFLDLVGKKVY